MTGDFGKDAPGVGRGVRPLGDGGWIVARLRREWGLVVDPVIPEDGSPLPSIPLNLRMDLLRLTYIELHQRPGLDPESWTRLMPLGSG
ncbi:hypothetical protein ACIRQQ_48970 [Streptomyces fuscichromogenes]|uniref:hypothetical protein n=1 Tax=Streptomyces fuscichromogenes TaxID=1324013 RepID=UPI00380740C2